MQEAYAQIRAERRRSPTRPSSPLPPTDPDLDARLANLERELREKAAAAREKAQRAAREAAATRAARASQRKPKRPSDEELGYIKTDDTIGKILADAREEFSRRFEDATEEPVSHRAADLLEDLASWLKRDPGSDDRADKSTRKRS